MSEDIDSTISLNISTPHTRPKKAVDIKRRVTGNRGQRIKARKSIKRLKEKLAGHQDNALILEEVKSQRPENAETTVTEKESESPRSSGKFNKKEDEKKITGDVISSLFRRNPDIPTITSSSVKQLKEDLFSSDSFRDVPLHPYMVSNLEKLGFTKMTAVQHQTLPHLVLGHDLLVKSQTGSGKTMAYAIPIIEDLSKSVPKIQRSDGCHAVIVVPTRELALQSYDVFLKLLKPFTWLVPGCIIGGEKRKAEKARLRKGINILIATPGRLIDHLENTQCLLLDKIKWLVLDEADRLLDLGFEEKVSKIVTALDKQSSTRQTVLLSATLTDGVERLAGMSLKDPHRVSVAQSSGTSQVYQKPDKSLQNKSNKQVDTTDSNAEKFALPESLKQYFVITPCKLRLVVLLTMILSKCKKQSHKKMIVFVSTQDAVEFLYRLVHYLSTDHSPSSDVEDAEPTTSLDVYRLHGDMLQKDRTSTYQDFCSARSGVMICTDVAARGLHLPFVEWVVQYTCSTGVTDYVHRVGRTARAGTSGQSILFLLPSEIEFIHHLNQQNISLEEMKVGQILQEVTKLLPLLPGIQDSERQIPNTVEETATYLQNCCELYCKKDSSNTSLAIKAYQSFIRAYATYPHALKGIFHLRHLHLGHVAKTFGLREAPSNIGNIPGVNLKIVQGKGKHRDKDSRSEPKKRKLEVSEYTSPLIFTSHKKKKHVVKKLNSKLKQGPRKKFQVKK